MNFSDEYIINIKSLKNAEYKYLYKINKSFFSDFVYENINDVNLDVCLTLIKNNDLFDLTFNIEGTILTVCDRCNDDLLMPINFTHHLFIQLSDNPKEEGTDIIFIPSNTTEIDVSPLIFEAVIFSIPMRHVHEYDEKGNSLCNEETLKILSSYLKEENNITFSLKCEELKKLLN
ncbi:MAG: DUF177 domain-containing protein [Bacteroidales bacterium]|nr:DUF177 domain-containing protein [Bacteroidales bacterium]